MASSLGANPPAPAQGWRYWLPRAGLITAAIVWIFWPALHGGWLWDDEWYIRFNPLMRSGLGLWKLWYQPGSWVEYYPLEESVHWLQWHFWGRDTLGYHLTNIILHLVSCLLLWKLFARLGLRHAWVGGLLFAVHPAQVESVAMISELKNALSLPFFLLSMLSWIKFDETRRKEDYQWALFLYVLAMLCKITMAPFPVVILLYSWWKRGRMAITDLKASVPFFVVAIGLAVAGHVIGQAYMQYNNAVAESVPSGTPLDCLSNAGLILALYSARSLLLADKLMSYPQWPLGDHLLLGFLCWAALAALLALLWRRRAGWGRHALLGLGFFLLMLAPFLGLHPISYMSFVWAMDHMLYLPLIGIVGLVVAAANGLEALLPRGARWALGGALAALVILQVAESRAMAVTFQSDEAFWSYIEARNPWSWIAHNNLGQDSMKRGQVAQAIAHFQWVQRLAPDYSYGYYNMAVALDQIGRTEDARRQYLQALAVNPRDDVSCVNLAELAYRKGDKAGEEQWLERAVKLNPHNPGALIDLANVYVKSNRVDQALDLYAPAVKESPESADLRYSYGSALLFARRWADAAEQLRAAVELEPRMGPAHEDLALALARSGDVGEAIEELNQALRLDPGSRTARDNLGMVLTQGRRYDEATRVLQGEIKAHPDDKIAIQFLQKVEAVRQAHPGP